MLALLPVAGGADNDAALTVQENLENACHALHQGAVLHVRGRRLGQVRPTPAQPAERGLRLEPTAVFSVVGGARAHPAFYVAIRYAA